MNERRSEEILSGLTALRESFSELQQKLDALEENLREAALELAQPAGGEPDLARLNQFVQRLNAGTTQEEILEVFLEEARSCVDRTILFLEKEDGFYPWKSIGFEPDAIESVVADSEADPVIRASRQKILIYRKTGVEEIFPWAHQTGGSPAFAACLPLIVGESAPIVLYADSVHPLPLDTLELLSHLTGLVVKNHYLHHLIQKPDESVPTAGVIEEREPPQEPVFESPAPPASPEPLPTPPSEHAAAEAMAPPAPEASVILEEPAPVPEPARPPEPAPAPERTPEASVVSAEFPSAEEEERLHNDARRFARLLVSEIKLYNEEEVESGRRDRDLYRRLRRDIDRSREMYEKRVHPSVSDKTDYFHLEMVRILAREDLNLMGKDYPGPQTGQTAASRP